MPDEPFDPIQIAMSQALDRRFARFDFATDNSPSDPDKSIPLRGSVEFGVRRQKGARRTYKIGIKCAFLEIEVENGRFEHNMKMQEQVQAGKLQESGETSRQQERKVGTNVRLEAETNALAVKASAVAKATGALEDARRSDETSKWQYDRYRVQWVAGGVRFGDFDGDPYNRCALLVGVFLENGNWGSIVPNRGATA